MGKLSGINTQTVWGLCFTPSLSHPNNRIVYTFIYKTCTLAVHRKWYMNEYQWTVFVLIWHIDMYLPFCVSIFCCYHACIAWLYQNSLTPLAMYCECFRGQSWGVMTCGDFIKLSIVVIEYMKYIDMFIIIIIRIPVTKMFTNIAHFYFCLCWHSFFLFICNNRSAWFEFCAFASDHINMWMLKINKDNLRLCSVYHKFHESSLRGIGCSFR